MMCCRFMSVSNFIATKAVTEWLLLDHARPSVIGNNGDIQQTQWGHLALPATYNNINQYSLRLIYTDICIFIDSIIILLYIPSCSSHPSHILPYLYLIASYYYIALSHCSFFIVCFYFIIH